MHNNLHFQTYENEIRKEKMYVCYNVICQSYFTALRHGEIGIA